MNDDAVLLVGHGTVTDLSQIPDFLRRIRRGRPADAELVQEVRRRYERVGGSPLLDITRRQADLLCDALQVPVHVAMRMADPLLEDVLADLASAPPRRLIVLPAAPFSVHVYRDATARALERLAARFRQVPELVTVKPWGMQEAFIRGHVESIRPHLASPQAATALMLTAHSLPLPVIAAGDPYQEQFEQCAREVAGTLGWPATIAYQSQGQGGGEWLGPDLRTALEAIRAAGTRRVVLAPIGFLTEHVETLYDLDVEAQQWCQELGLECDRVGALNDSPELIAAMVSAVRDAQDGH